MSKKENGEYSFNDPPQKTEIKVDKKLYISDKIKYHEFLRDIRSSQRKPEIIIDIMKLSALIEKEAIVSGARRVSIN